MGQRKRFHFQEQKTPGKEAEVYLKEFVSSALAQVEEVERVLTARHDNLFEVWTVVDKFDSSIRRKIYAREKAIIDEFEGLEFDFNIVSRRGRSINQLISDSGLELTYRRS